MTDPAPSAAPETKPAKAAPKEAAKVPVSGMPKNTKAVHAELMACEEPLPERGAALYAGHLYATLGREKFAALKEGEAAASLKSFRTKAALAGQALRVSDAVRFAQRLTSFQIEHVDAQEYLRLVHEVLQAAKQ